MRVAVTQFATSSNYQENLATCIRMITKAAICEPSLIILPEFCNTLFSAVHPTYGDHNQAWHEALTINGNFLQQIAQQAKKYKCYIALNVTLRRELVRDHQNPTIKSNITVTSCLFSPTGELILQNDQQQLAGQAKVFFTAATKAAEAINTPFGKLGVIGGHDGQGFKASRELALVGAQLLCNSQSSFALDQSTLHEYARACENNLFIATANKSGSLIIQEQADVVPLAHGKEHAEATSSFVDSQAFIAQEYLFGTGQSQIIAPDGKVLAKLAHNTEGFVFADIACTDAGLKQKFRPDGTALIDQRRPELYQKPAVLSQAILWQPEYEHRSVPETANVAIFATYKSNEQAIDDVCHYIENNLSDIIQLPELFFIDDKTITNNREQRTTIASLSTALIKSISAVLRPFQYVCTSLVIDGAHQAVLIGEHGLVASQQQLHFCQRYQWTDLGDELNIIKLPLEQGNINVALLTGDDANIPELFKMAVLSNIEVLLVPFDIQESSEVEFCLLSRATEHRICLVAASREKSFPARFESENCEKKVQKFNKVKQQKSTGLIANLATELALLKQWKSAKFSGYINKALVKHQHGKITKAVIHPKATTSKL